MLTRRPWNAFFNTKTIASYHFDLQLVVFDDCELNTLENYDSLDTAQKFEIMLLAAHEYTHWRDSITTLWGRRLIDKFYKGIDVRLQNNPREFSHIVNAKRAIFRCTCNKYFKTTGPFKSERFPWGSTLTTGLAFDCNGISKHDDPIPFVRFWKPPINSEETLIVRMPISAASLSELRAMYCEYQCITNGIEMNSTTRSRKFRKWLGEYDSQIYNHEYVEYSAALHLLANKTGIGTIMDILPYGSALAGIAFNFPEALIDRLKIPSDWKSMWCSDGNDRIQPLLEQRHPGFLYSLMCKYADKPIGIDVIDWINKVLQNSGDIAYEDFIDEWKKEIRNSRPPLNNPILREIRDIWSVQGAKWIKESEPIMYPSTLVKALNQENNLELPGAYSSELKVWLPHGSTAYGNKKQTKARVEFLDSCIIKINEFCDICGS